MQPQPPPPNIAQHPDEYLEIAEKVRTGEYFREAQSMYDLTVHDPMSERYMFIAITVFSMLIFFLAFMASQGLYPLTTTVPFIYNENDIVEDLPRIHSLIEYKGQKPSEALLHFFVRHYVTTREEYNIETFDRDLSGIKSQSTDEVFKEFQQQITPENPDSPITLYQRFSNRNINVISVKPTEEGVEVMYEALVEGKGTVKKSIWVSNIAFNYSGIALDENTGKVKPVNFVVTHYRTKRLQD